MLRAEAVHSMGESANKRIVLTSASKFNTRSVVRLWPADAVTTVVTDAVPGDSRAALEKAGVEIILA
jgi:DeoR/GlpR family transcriptional regulator of sugar metabolism